MEFHVSFSYASCLSSELGSGLCRGINSLPSLRLCAALPKFPDPLVHIVIGHLWRVSVNFGLRRNIRRDSAFYGVVVVLGGWILGKILLGFRSRYLFFGHNEWWHWTLDRLWKKQTRQWPQEAPGARWNPLTASGFPSLDRFLIRSIGFVLRSCSLPRNGSLLSSAARFLAFRCYKQDSKYQLLTFSGCIIMAYIGWLVFLLDRLDHHLFKKVIENPMTGLFQAWRSTLCFEGVCDSGEGLF